MSWAGFSSGGLGGAGGAGGSGTSGYAVNFTYANRGGAGRGAGHFSAGYGRGSSMAFGGGYGGVGGGGGGYSGGFSYGTSNSTSSGLASTVGSGAGSETPRVAVLGVSSAVVAQWAALHAGGLRVSVVVGTGDSSVCHSRYTGAAADTTDTKPPVISLAERTAAAEPARACATRCVDFFKLPTPTKSVPTSAITTAAAAEGSAEKPRITVRVCVSDGSGEAAASATGGTASPPPVASTMTMTTLANRRASATATPDADRDGGVVATSWSWFFKPMLDALGGADKGTSGGSASSSASPSKTMAGSYWSARGSTTTTASAATASAAANSLLLIDEVEVVYVVGYGSACDEAGLRATLIWLLEREKHIVVDCALSCDTLGACAAVAAGVVRGRPEMKRIFLYRGAGARRGWPDAAVAQLRKSIGLQRGTGKPAPAKVPTPPPARGAATPTGSGVATASAAATPSKSGNVFTAASTKAAAASDADDGFSVFDLMGSSFGGALKDAEASGSEKSSAKPSPAVASLPAAPAVPVTSISDAAKPAGATDTASSAAVGTPSPPTPPPPTPPAPTSIALDGASSVVGTVRRINFVVMGRAPPPPRGCAAVAALGVMATLGWDAVAAALRLMDWTCPDMVVGHVRRGGALRPTCVQAELYYGVEGTARELEEGTTAGGGASAQTTSAPQPARPTYLCVSLHVADSASTATTTAEAESLPAAASNAPAAEDADIDDDGGDVVQQSLRIVGSNAVLTVLHPLVPVAAAADAPGSAATPTPSPTPASTATTTTIAGAASSVTPSTTPAAVPMAPRVAHRYVLATQDFVPTTGQRERRESTVDVGAAEPASAFRLWQRVRSQLRVTAQSTSTSAGFGGGVGAGTGAGGYQPYGARYGNRGVGGAGGYYGRGRGGPRGRAAGFGAASGMSGAAPAPSGPSLKAELTGTEAAALDVQHAWLVQKVVQCILESATASAASP